MSFDPRISRLLKTNVPEWRRGLVVRDSLTAVRRRLAIWLADPQFLAVEQAALGKPWVERVRRRMPGLHLDDPNRAERAQAEVHADALHLGRRWPTANSRFVAKIASGVSGLNAHAWDRLAGGDPFVSHAFLSALEDSGSVGPGTGWTPAPILVEDEASHLRRRRARLSQDPQPGRICVRPRLGRGLGARGRRILSQAAGRRAVHAGARSAAARQPAAAAARRDRSGHRPERHVVGAHHLHRRGRRGRVRAARLADPPRHPISLVQPRLFELRRFPRRADQPQAQGDPQGARRGARRVCEFRALRGAGRSARPNGTRCGPSTRTPAAGSGAVPI